jgi:nicotinate-nucleotide adenylyltransferase
VRVECIEEELPVPSYTIHTLDALAARHPEHRFHLVVGADILPQLPLWKEAERLTRIFPLLVVGRQGYTAIEDTPSFPDVSSTEIRARIAAGASVDHLLPTAVARVLNAHGLYRQGT